jgi:hypothetical protein
MLDGWDLDRRWGDLAGSLVKLGDGVGDAFTGVVLEPVGIIDIAHCPRFRPKAGLDCREW